MGQPVLTAILAFAIAAFLTAAVAIGTPANAYIVRAIKLTAIGVFIAVATVAITQACLRINFTASMPIGLYLLMPLPSSGVKRGMLVAACAPARAARVGRRRGYLAAGPCPEHTVLLLKYVEAVTGDEVEITPGGGFVNGWRLPSSRSARRDRAGRRLVSWPTGAYRLAAGQVWLYAPNDRSWDSRYWGPALQRNIAAEAIPLFVLRGAVP
jgi:conjugative transfer signal peptidase TraF